MPECWSRRRRRRLRQWLYDTSRIVLFLPLLPIIIIGEWLTGRELDEPLFWVSKWIRHFVMFDRYWRKRMRGRRYRTARSKRGLTDYQKRTLNSLFALDGGT